MEFEHDPVNRMNGKNMPSDIDEIEILRKLVNIVSPVFDILEKDSKTRKELITTMNNEMQWCLSEQFPSLGDTDIKALCKPINGLIDYFILEYECDVENTPSPLEGYRSGGSGSGNGLGFGIVSNNPISTLTYGAMVVHNERVENARELDKLSKEMKERADSLRRSRANLTKRLIDKMYVCLRKMVKLGGYLAQTKAFVETYPDFYTNPQKYDPHAADDIYQRLCRIGVGGRKDGFFCEGGYKEEILADISYLGGRGYIYTLSFVKEVHTIKPITRVIAKRTDAYGYTTTLKYEQEVLLGERGREAQREQCYRAAEADLKKKKYYEAAVGFGKVSGYKDATKRSVQIWNEFIFPSLQKAASSLKSAKDLDLRRDKKIDISKWPNAVRALELGYESKTVVVLKKDGTVFLEGEKELWMKPVQSWHDIVDLGVKSWVIVGVRSDGRVEVAAKNEADRSCLVDLCGIVKARGDILLTDEGKCVSISSDEKYLNEENVVEVFSDYILHADGTIGKFGPERDSLADRYPEYLDWNDIVWFQCEKVLGEYQWIGIKKDGTCIVGQTVQEYIGVVPPSDEKIRIRNRKYFRNINTIQEEIEEQEEKIRKEIEAYQTEMSELKGLFRGIKRKKFEKEIQTLESSLKSLTTDLD